VKRHVALLTALALALVACGAEKEVAPAAAPPQLRTGVVEMRDVELAYSAEATVEAVRQSTVSSQIAGRIVELRFDVGDVVKKGDVTPDRRAPRPGAAARGAGG
jgi:multidrug efflux pump subunit AcrA (membrane-fusion protein)